MRSSLGCKRGSSSKVSSTPVNSAVGETRRDQNTVHADDTIFDPSETLDQLLLFDHQLNPDQNIHNTPSGNQDINPDPVQVSIAPTRATVTCTQAAANRSNQRASSSAPRQKAPSPSAPTPNITSPLVQYRECQKNHAAKMGSNVVDGCGEFIPSGEEGTSEALICAACDCHRNFHRKEIDGESQYAANYHCPYYNPNHQRNAVPHHHHHHQRQQHQFRPQPLHHRISYNSPTTAKIAPVMMTFDGGGSCGGLDESSSEDLNMFQSTARGETSAFPRSSRKRFRTKFSEEQKNRMLEFAEKLGWRIQKPDEPEVLEFCTQVGVKRQVFKVWMHNNKQSSKKKQMIFCKLESNLEKQLRELAQRQGSEATAAKRS